MTQVDLSILIVNYNTQHLLAKLFDSLEVASTHLITQIIVVDNASNDNSVDWLQSHQKDFELIVNANNVGFGRANNQGLALAKGRYVLLLNTDAFIAENTLSKTFLYMEKNVQCGVLGVKLVGRDGGLQPSCRYFPTFWNLFLERSGLTRFFPKTQMVDDMEWGHDKSRSCDWVPGCYYLIRREVIDEVGLFDPRYFLYYEEVDHCLATKKAGWEVHYFPHTSVVHLGGESAKSEGELTHSGSQLEGLQTESELLYFRKNHGLYGLAVHILLSMLSDFINFGKGILKRKSFTQCGQYLKHSVLVWKLFLRTRTGLFPTR